MRKFGRVPRPRSLQAFRVIVGVLVVTAMWGFLTQRLNSLVAVRGVCAADLEVLNLPALQGKGLQWGTGGFKDCLAILPVSAGL